MVIKNPECLLDQGLYDGAATGFGHGGTSEMSPSSCCAQMMMNKRPPLSPARFGALMRARVDSGELRFTAKADMETVIGQYAHGLEVAFDGLGLNRTVMSVGYNDLGWGDDEGELAVTHPMGARPTALTNHLLTSVCCLLWQLSYCSRRSSTLPSAAASLTV